MVLTLRPLHLESSPFKVRESPLTPDARYNTIKHSSHVHWTGGAAAKSQSVSFVQKKKKSIFLKAQYYRYKVTRRQRGVSDGEKMLIIVGMEKTSERCGYLVNI